ncbi:gamma-glutamyl-gamma-aminobutyrate hydrolase family protein [Bdellovibrio bacteriovorus]|uniref:gamma-glutamyl-gamma-aminobutyrate hydrolase family protein n=1 Tax=Bdellovibrio TaxID=958 RepID=UPI0035A978C9
METAKPLLIGLSPRILHEAPEGFEARGKTIQYLEQNLAHLIAKHGALVFMIPSLETSSILNKEDLDVNQYADVLDGLVLQGGVDICPSLYGEEPIPAMENQRTDPVRDRYEIKLLKAFAKRQKPVLGICRGFQLMNVFKGGTLFQDLPSQRPDKVAHFRADLYDRLTHSVEIEPGGRLAKMYTRGGEIVSIHHQGIKKLGEGLRVEATSSDGLIEAFSATENSFFVGVQWHPEFHKDFEEHFLSSEPLVRSFLEACKSKEVPQEVQPILNPS